MATLDDILNVGVPAILILVVVGFIWIKFLNPFVIPMIKNMVEYFKGKNIKVPGVNRKEISYE